MLWIREQCSVPRSWVKPLWARLPQLQIALETLDSGAPCGWLIPTLRNPRVNRWAFGIDGKALRDNDQLFCGIIGDKQRNATWLGIIFTLVSVFWAPCHVMAAALTFTALPVTVRTTCERPRPAFQRLRANFRSQSRLHALRTVRGKHDADNQREI